MKHMLLVSMLVVSGCGGGSTPSASPPGSTANNSSETRGAYRMPRAAMSLTMKMIHRDAMGSTRTVSPNGTLRSGDQFGFIIDAPSPVYVYLVMFFADGTTSVLFPQRGENNRIRGRAEIPDKRADALVLDKNIGEENVYVIASSRPLGDAASSLKQKVDRIRTSATEGGSTANKLVGNLGNKPASQKETKPAGAPKQRRKSTLPPPPKITRLTIGTRGRGAVRKRRNETEIQLTGDQDGVVVYRFTFNHVAQ